MRDVSAKSSSLRTARAEATLRLDPSTIRLIQEGKAPKGDPLMVARVAGIQGAKNTPLLIPYCHSVALDYVSVDFELSSDAITVTTSATAIYKTGVEMEALTAAAVAALNLYDLLKPVDETMEILSVKLLEKTGGKSQVRNSDSFSASVIVVSDRVAAGTSADVSGSTLRRLLVDQGGKMDETENVADESEAIIQAVKAACARGRDLIVTTGGTGLGPRDRTPDAVIPLLESRLTGLEHRLNDYGQQRLPGAMLGRPFAGRIGNSVVVGLPGSPGAVEDAVAALFPYMKHAFHIIKGGDHDN